MKHYQKILLILVLGIFAYTWKNGGSSIKRFFKTVETYNYSEQSIPHFFESVVANHSKDFKALQDTKYYAFLKDFDLSDNLENEQQYFKIEILHKLFTSKGARNCTTGEILNIPYMWHWIENNPRHLIRYKKDQLLISTIKPKGAFKNYKSIADIDRTPYLFLSELFSKKEIYSLEGCADFSTFGWCSEREMAFASLFKIFGYKSKVTSSKGHSWSEVIMEFRRDNRKKIKVKFLIDNTFDKIEFSEISNTEISTWQNELGNSKTEKWYNKMKNDPMEIRRISAHMVKEEEASLIESKIVDYLERN